MDNVIVYKVQDCFLLHLLIYLMFSTVSTFYPDVCLCFVIAINCIVIDHYLANLVDWFSIVPSAANLNFTSFHNFILYGASCQEMGL